MGYQMSFLSPYIINKDVKSFMFIAEWRGLKFHLLWKGHVCPAFFFNPCRCQHPVGGFVLKYWLFKPPWSRWATSSRETTVMGRSRGSDVDELQISVSWLCIYMYHKGIKFSTYWFSCDYIRNLLCFFKYGIMMCTINNWCFIK